MASNRKQVIYALLVSAALIMLLILIFPYIFKKHNKTNRIDFVYEDVLKKTINKNDDIYGGLMENGWIYYTNNSDGGKLYKIKLDGSCVTRLNNNRTEVFAIQGDYVFYTDLDKSALYKIKTDGSNKTYIFGGKRKAGYEARGLKLIDGWIYYSDWYNMYAVYKVRTDGSEITQITGEIYNIGITITNEWIYYIDYMSRVLYRTSIDGTDIVAFDDTTTYDYSVRGDWVYVLNSTSNDINSKKLFKIKSDGSIKQIMLDKNVEHFDVQGNTLYYCYFADGNSSIECVNKINVDGTEDTLMYYGVMPSSNLLVKGQWLYFTPLPGPHVDYSDVWRMSINPSFKK